MCSIGGGSQQSMAGAMAGGIGPAMRAGSALHGARRINPGASRQTLLTGAGPSVKGTPSSGTPSLTPLKPSILTPQQ